ncbi:NAD(P)H-binding protein [Phytomonospora sp. NPDC050363]|uniref:NAD(P)-dependent oxidoreductase n=1 Tax=Phytomonospora sp. NPDC050363 TaxID=3155642 RepID=UPI0033F983F5
MSRIVVFGAGGRAGRAVTAEAVARGHEITAVVRDPARHAEFADGVEVVAGDVGDPASVASVTRGHDAAVNAVSPASDPEALKALGTLDAEVFSRAADALLATGVSRLIAIGLFANLLGADGRPIHDDPAAFPQELREFALAHTAGLERLRAQGEDGVDWLMLTPPPALDVAGPRTGAYRLGGEELPEGEGLSYADLAVAVVDEIESPRHHRTRVSVTGA